VSIRQLLTKIFFRPGQLRRVNAQLEVGQRVGSRDLPKVTVTVTSQHLLTVDVPNHQFPLLHILRYGTS